MASGFDPEAFKAQLKEELLAETRSMMREMMEEITKLIKENQPMPPTGPVDLGTELPGRDRKEDDMTVLADPVGRENMVQTKDVEQSDWAKNITKAMNQMQIIMKEKGMTTPMDYTDLTLDEEDDPLPRKFKFPDMKKYSGTDDPHLHLKQYVTYMKPTGLSKAQIIKQFPLSLEGAAIKWYYTLDAHIQQDWKELCSAFIKQYGLNSQFEVSLRELQNTTQESDEPFTDFLTRWREKLAQMKCRPAESDQLDLAIEACVPPLASKLKDMGIRDFKELYHFGVQVEANLDESIHE